MCFDSAVFGHRRVLHDHAACDENGCTPCQVRSLLAVPDPRQPCCVSRLQVHARGGSDYRHMCAVRCPHTTDCWCARCQHLPPRPACQCMTICHHAQLSFACSYMSAAGSNPLEGQCSGNTADSINGQSCVCLCRPQMPGSLSVCRCVLGGRWHTLFERT